jgi:hypothetical protein
LLSVLLLCVVLFGALAPSGAARADPARAAGPGVGGPGGDGPGVGGPVDPGADAAALIRIRAGDHPGDGRPGSGRPGSVRSGYGRLVLDLPAGAVPVVTVSATGVTRGEGAGVTVRITPAARRFRFAAVPAPPRNTLAMRVGDGVLEVATAPGVTLRQTRLHGRLVLDFPDPAPAPATVAAIGARSAPLDRPTPASSRRVPSPAVAAFVASVAAPAPDATASASAPADRSAPDPMASDPIAPYPIASDPTARARRGRVAPPIAAAIAARRPGAAPMSPGALPEAVAATALAPAAAWIGQPSNPTRPMAAPDAPAPSAADQAAPGAIPAAGPFRLPVAARAGVAALRRGDVGLLVADAETAADPAAWRALPGLAAATVTSLPGATLVVFPLPAAPPGPDGAAARGDVVLDHGPAGWMLDLSAPPTGAAAAVAAAGSPGIDLTMQPPNLVLRLTGASRVISVADPLGGGVLLIGTLLPVAAPIRIVAGRRMPSLVLPPTWRGVAVEPLSDALDMRPEPYGFTVDLGPQRSAFGALPEGGTAGAAAAGFSRRFDLPRLPVAALLNREDAAAGAVSLAPPRGRGAAELRLAETLVALGLGVEAQAVLRLGVAADGRLATDPEAVALSGVAAVLGHRLAEAGGLDDASARDDPVGADEIALWRALRAVTEADAADDPPPPDAARTIAGRQAILLAYPSPLRDRLLPVAAEAMAAGGEARAAERLIAAAGPAPGLDYARALLDIHAGRLDAALARLDRLAALPDRSVRARAAVRAVELRLASGALTPARAADALDREIAAWRGDERELRVRLRVAQLRALAGQFRPALALLRETRALGAAGAWTVPERADVSARLAAVFAETLAHDDAAPMDPLDFVSLIEDNADLLPTGPAGERVAERVADRLAELDLPERAAAALRRLVDAAPPGAARAALGARLAADQLRDGDARGALTTLSGSTAVGLPAALVATRTLTYARATAKAGNVDAASGALAALDTPAADALRTDLLEQAGRWTEVTAALSRRLGVDVPADGPVPKTAVPLVLRLASAAAQTGDETILNRIRMEYLPRMAPGDTTDMLRVLTEGPVRGVADLPRAAQEAALAHSVTR